MGYLQIQKDNTNPNIPSISFFSQNKNAATGKTINEAQLSGWRGPRMVVVILIADDQNWQMVMRNAREIIQNRRGLVGKLTSSCNHGAWLHFHGREYSE